MKASALIARLVEPHAAHGDLEVYLDVCNEGLIEVGEVDVDAEDTGIIIWKAEE